MDNERGCLQYLFAPKSIAIVGASPKPGQGLNPLANLRSIGYSGAIYAVNPKYDQVLDLPCYPNLASVPERVEAVYLAVPNMLTVPLLKEAVDVGVRAAVILAGGFGETGQSGKEMEREIADIARSAGIAVAGPNCLGLINFHDRVCLWGASMPAEVKVGGIGAVLQSGSAAITLLNSGCGLGFSYLVSSGNEVCVDLADYFEFFLHDARVRVLAGLVEGIRDPAKFLRVADQALRIGKPIVMLKPGRSDEAKRAVLAHTGSLAGSDKVCEVLFRQKGIVRVEDLDELVQACVLFSCLGDRPIRGGLALTSPSGGEIAMILDIAREMGITFAELAETTVNRLRVMLPTFGRPSNPLDITGAGVYAPDLFRQLLTVLVEDENVGVVAVAQDAPPGMGTDQARRYFDLASVVVSVAQQVERPIIFFSNLSSGMDRSIQEVLGNGGVPALRGTRASLRAISGAIRRSRVVEGLGHGAPEESKLQRLTAPKLEFVRSLLRGASGRVLGEMESASLLSAYGIPTARAVLARDVGEAIEGSRILGFPVVLKIVSPQIQHKTDVGGVVLNIRDADGVRHGYAELIGRVARRAPNAEVCGVLVQEMVQGGTEVVAGITRDPEFGHVVVFGLGGIFVEILKDISLRPVPLRRRDAEEMITEIKGYPIVAGSRGRPPLDTAALVDVLLRLSELALDLSEEVEEIDINPLIVFERGAKAVDALVVLARSDVMSSVSAGRAQADLAGLRSNLPPLFPRNRPLMR